LRKTTNNMKKQILFLNLLLFISVFTKAQQDPQFSQNMFTHLLTNPGYAGSNDNITVYALNRTQWTGFEGSPMVTTLNMDAAINPFNVPLGIGLSLQNDELGFNKDLQLNISVAYKQPLGDGNLGIGVKWGVANTSISTEGAEWITPVDPVENDIAIPVNGTEDMSMMDFGFGIFYKTQDLYLGISSTHINQAEFTLDQSKTRLTRHYYVTAGYNLPFNNPLFEFKPGLIVQSDGKNSQLGFHGLIEYNKKIWGGVSLRTDYAITGIFGVELFKWVKVSYSYDFVVSDLMEYNDGSHEIMMGFSFDVKKDKTPERYKSIRFL